MVASVLSKLDTVSFDELLANQDPFKSDTCALDLRDYQFISPGALVQLAALCHALHGDSRKPRISVEDDSIRNYLLRVGFVAAVHDVVRFVPAFPPPRIFERFRGSNPLLIEVTRIESGRGLPRLLDQIVVALRQRLRYEKNHAFDVATAVSEICQNTFDHNSATCGFLAMQVFGQGKGQFLEIGVADYGDGLTSTLKRNPKNGMILGDVHAITRATELHTSQHDDPTRGTGLYHLLEIAYQHQGSVQIRTGAGKVRYRMDRRRGWQFPVAQMPGVQIALSLPTKRRA